uniref:Putative secreted protein n=1 Tax=Rhipicephalus microplus TaxID=6941 RepID=A0A6M2DAJ5_RHIMP
MSRLHIPANIVTIVLIALTFINSQFVDDRVVECLNQTCVAGCHQVTLLMHWQNCYEDSEYYPVKKSKYTYMCFIFVHIFAVHYAN